MNLLRIFDRHPRADLSPYVDGELSSRQAERLELHLASCPACHAELASLRTLRSALAGIPEVRAPRSFALTPRQVAAPAPAPASAGPGPAFIAMRVAGAGVAAVLALVVFLDRDGGSDHTGNDDSAAFSALEAQDRSAAGDMSDGDLPASASGEYFSADATLVPGSAPDSAGEDTDKTTNALPADGDNGAGMAGGPAPDEGAPTVNDAEALGSNDEQSAAGDSIAGDDAERDNAIEALSQATDDDGISTMTVIQIALAVVAAGALVGGFVLPLFVKRNI